MTLLTEPGLDIKVSVNKLGLQNGGKQRVGKTKKGSNFEAMSEKYSSSSKFYNASN